MRFSSLSLPIMNRHFTLLALLILLSGCAMQYSGGGVMVVSVEQGSEADITKITKNDFIISVNNIYVETPADVEAIFHRALQDKEKKVLIYVESKRYSPVFLLLSAKGGLKGLKLIKSPY